MVVKIRANGNKNLMGGIFQTLSSLKERNAQGENIFWWNYLRNPEYDLDSKEIQFNTKWTAPYDEKVYKKINRAFPKLKLTDQFAEIDGICKSDYTEEWYYCWAKFR